MHEMSLAEGVLGIIEDQAAREPFERVRVVRLEIGTLSHADPEALRFCLDVVLKGSLGDGAAVEIEQIPGQGQCLSCAAEVRMEALYDPCPQCGEYGLRVTGGTEMRLTEIEVD